MLLKWSELTRRAGWPSVLATLAVFFAAVYWLSESGFRVFSPWAVMSRGNSAWIVSAFVFLSLGFVARAARWHYLTSKQLSVSEALAINGVFYAANVLLPLRLGEGVRPLLLTKRGSTGLMKSIGLVVWERLFDLAFTVGILTMGALSPHVAHGETVTLGSITIDTEVVHDGTTKLMLAALAGLSLLPLLLAFRSTTDRIAELLPRRVGGIFSRTMHELLKGLDFLRDLRCLSGFLLVTSIYWLCVVTSIWMLVQGAHLEPSILQSCFLMGLLVFGMLLPAPPAQLGLHHAVSLAALLMCFRPEAVEESGSLFAGAYYFTSLAVHVIAGLLGYSWLTKNPANLTPARK